jgi:hypothetical protein
MKVRSSPGAVPHATVHASHASPIKKTIGTGIGALDLGALEKAAQKLGLLDVAPKASLAEQNAAAFPGTTLRFAAPDDAARGFAQSAVAATLAAAVDRDQRRAAADKHPAASPEQHLMKLGAQALITHIRVAWGVDENLKGKSPAEVAERQRLSTAIVAELSGRLFREIPFERFFRDNPARRAGAARARRRHGRGRARGPRADRAAGARAAGPAGGASGVRSSTAWCWDRPTRSCCARPIGTPTPRRRRPTGRWPS